MSKRILLTSLLVTLFVLIFFTVASIEIYHGQTVDEAENTLTARIDACRRGPEPAQCRSDFPAEAAKKSALP